MPISHSCAPIFQRCRTLLTPMSHSCAPNSDVSFRSCAHITLMCTHLRCRNELTPMSHPCHTHVHPTENDVAFSSCAHLTLMFTHLKCRNKSTPMSNACAPNSDVAFSTWPCHSQAPLSQMSHLAQTHVTPMCTQLRCRIWVMCTYHIHVHASQMSQRAHTHVTPMSHTCSPN